MELDFILCEMTALKYFIPIVIESKKHKIKSNFFCDWEIYSNKYCSIKKNRKTLYQISNEHDFHIKDIKEITNRINPVLTIEDVGIKNIQLSNKIQKFYSINYSGDFISNFESYKNKFENIFMISEYFADYYKCNDKKNLFFGSPKFDVNLDNKDIFKKYKLKNNQKYALVFYPRRRDINKIKIRNIYSYLRSLGYKLIVKTRGKDPIYNFLNRGDCYFVDDSWYPHISLELIKISEIVINFGSAAIEECVMMNTPVVDFNIKPFEKVFKSLYEYKFVINFEPQFTEIEFKKAINYLVKTNFKTEFKKAQQKNLFNKNFNSSQKILKYILKDNYL